MVRTGLLVLALAVVGLVLVDGVDERSASVADARIGNGPTASVTGDSATVTPGAPLLSERTMIPTSQPPTTLSPTTLSPMTLPPATQPPTTIPVVEPEPLTVPSSGSAQPVHIRIASLGIEAPVHGVGVDPEGDFDVPSAEQVGWYRFGPSPGDSGSSVLAAHVDYDRRPGVFFRLEEIAEGDEIAIEFDDGSSERFVVITQLLYDKSVLPAAELFRSDGRSVLRLVTCGGTFDDAAGSYQGNRVVTAVPID